MNGKRYFYTDPLAAAWQAKHFGMTFFCEYTPAERRTFNIPQADQSFPFADCGFEGGNIEKWNEVIAASKTFRRIYVHAESLQILEPRQGDRGIDRKGGMYIFGDGNWYRYGSSGEAIASLPVQIIWRNGKSFLSPESEDA